MSRRDTSLYYLTAVSQIRHLVYKEFGLPSEFILGHHLPKASILNKKDEKNANILQARSKPPTTIT